MKLKEDLRAFTDDSKTTEVFRIKAQQVWDPRARYDVTDVAPQARAATILKRMVKRRANPLYQVGTCLEVAPPERLVFTFGWKDLPPLEALNEAHELDSRVIVQFRDLGDTTEVSVTHERLETENMRAFHRWGWESTLDELTGTLGARG